MAESFTFCRRSICLLLAAVVCLASHASFSAAATQPADGNRLAYLNAPVNPYHVGRHFPKLTTPQWVGEEGVDAVVVLAIDDMRDTAKYEAYLRPILDRLKQIDGRAPVSIMTNKVDPAHPQLAAWLKEGVNIDCHTFDHPCPILKGGNFAAAKTTYDVCVDLMTQIPGNKPVAFRTPCCDSRNTVSPRLFAEIINRRTEKGHFLTLDSSVMNLLTANDPELPRELVLNADGSERFRRYLPAKGFVNVIEDYPYPYIIGNAVWEFPCVTPSDWSAQNLQKPHNPKTVEDWKAALDAVVVKKGVFNLVFHPHNWIKPEQVVELIDHAVAKHGKRVKFLSFREAQERLDKHLLAGQPVRRLADGGDNGVRLLDLNRDGYMDVLIGNEAVQKTRIWSPGTGTWKESDGGPRLVSASANQQQKPTHSRFGFVAGDALIVLESAAANATKAWSWTADLGWRSIEKVSVAGLEGEINLAASQLHDLDGDGECEWIIADGTTSAVLKLSAAEGAQVWQRLPLAMPKDVAFVDAAGKAGGLRLVDVDEDGYIDLLSSTEAAASLHLFTPGKGWDRKVFAGERKTLTETQAIPPIVRADGSDSGFFVHGRSLVWQNEETSSLPDLVVRRTFNEILGDDLPGPRSPQASLRSIQVKPGFEVKLVAAEPLVQDPVAFAFGADGKLWVVEMGDYPLGVNGKPGGRVKLLTDVDGDGVYDKASTFLEGLPFPSGVTAWRKGVLITAAPDILYAEDTTGDGVADKREVLFTGFGEGNQQHRVNGLWLGLDNWFYGANGHSNGTIKSVKTGKSADIRNRDFRIRPDSGEIEAVTGVSQFGRSRDDFDNWFGNDNTHPLFHFALADHYLRRNPHVVPPAVRLDVPDEARAGPVYPISRTLARFNDYAMANHFTSACGPVIYRGDSFGSAFDGNAFVCEPVHNLVSRLVLRPEGSTFRGSRASDEQDREFLASSDSWFRPTMARVGPDGALYVSDMYRLVIEHPQWIPKEWQEKLNLQAGNDLGRIYRIAPVGSKPKPTPRLDTMSAEQLAAAIDSPSSWQRDMAQQLLVERQDKAAVPALERLAQQAALPAVRVQALAALDGLSANTPEVLTKLLADAHPGVRRHAVRVAEPMLNQQPKLAEAVMHLSADPDSQVRIQVAYSLGALKDARAGETLAAMLLAHGDEPMIQAAAMSSLKGESLKTTLKSIRAGTNGNSKPPTPALLGALARMIHAEQDVQTFAILLDAVTSPKADGSYDDWQFEGIAAIDAATNGRDAYMGREGVAQIADSLFRMQSLVDAARLVVADEKHALPRRRTAAGVLGMLGHRWEEDRKVIDLLLQPGTPVELQVEAIRGIARSNRDDVPAVILAGWRKYTPALRTAALDALLTRSKWTVALLDAIEKGTLRPGDIDAARRQTLLKSKETNLRERANKLLADAVNSDRQKAIEAFRPSLALAGDAARGAEHFARTCAACHQVGGAKGNAVGPDLASVGDKSPEGLLTAIIDPNRAVEPRFISYTVETKTDDTLTGLLASESGEAITLIGSDGASRQILRADIARLRADGLSLMPEGLEAGLKPQDLADIIAFVRGARPAGQKRTFPGNTPAVVLPNESGTLRLSPATAEIAGKTLVLEEKLGNLGYWQSIEDQATWTLQPGRAGVYDVYLDYACQSPNEGNTLIAEIGSGEAANTRLKWKVEPTANWQTYRRVHVGQLTLAAGRQRITIRPDGPIKGALLDLRTVELVPAK